MTRTALVLLACFTVVCGGIYPLVVWGIAQLAFPWQANGSAVLVNGQKVGSARVGQDFHDPRYFWGRPSATTPLPYDGRASNASNFGPLNPALTDAVKGRIAALRAADPGNEALVPVDLVTASGSGLDPDESPAAALFQVTRVARARGRAEAEVRALVLKHVKAAQLGFLGPPRVNVLALNLALDGSGP